MSFVPMVKYSPWILASLGFLIAISVTAFIVQYRRAKRAPYFMWRQEAASKARRLLAVILFLSCALLGMFWLLRSGRWQEIPASPAISEKPVSPTEPLIAFTLPETPSPVSSLASPAALALPQLTTTLPAPVTPAPTLVPATPTAGLENTPKPSGRRLVFLAFAKGVSEGKQPVEPAESFEAHFGPVYAFFSYSHMTNGTPWSFTWTKDGSELARDMLLWQWGCQGHAYLYYQPPQGFEPGIYELSIFVEDELMLREHFSVR